MPSTVRGARTTDLVSSSLIKRSVFDAIYNFKPYQTPIAQWLMASKRNKLSTGNPKFETQEDVLLPHLIALSVAIAGGGATESLTAAADYIYVKFGDMLLNPSNGEVYRVTTAVSSSTLAVTRWPTGNITADTLATRQLINMGPAFAEKSASAEALSTVSTFPYNYCQILKKAVEMSGTQRATENYGGSDWANQRVKATEEFKNDIERTFLFGVRGIVTTAGAHVRATSGLTDSTSGAMGITDVSQFIGSAETGTDFPDETYFFETYLKNLFGKGSNSKTLYGGSTAMAAIGKFSLVKQQTTVKDTEYGYGIEYIRTPFGRAGLVWHPFLEGSMANWVIGLDKGDYLKYRYLSGNGNSRDMQYQENIHTPDVDERKDQYLAEIGMHLAGGSQGVHRILKPGATA